MKLFRSVLLLVLSLGGTAAYADIDISFGVEIAPPQQRVEVAPEHRPGFIWSPGYWVWDHGRHEWREGRWVEERRGQYWVPERWVEYREQRGSHWHFEPGHYERAHEHGYERERR